MVHSESNLMRVSKLYRFPIKSMGGEELQSVQVLQSGFMGDRRFAIIDVETGQVASAKVPRKWGTLLNFSAKYVSEPIPGEVMPVVEIKFPDGSVHHSDDDDIDARLTSAFGRDVRLVAKSPPQASSEALWRFVEGHEATEWTRQRTVGTEDGKDIVRWELAEAVPKVEGEDRFFDIAPIHLLTTSTLRRLEELEPGVDFDHRRFRPNILLETPLTGFVEQEWRGKAMWFEHVGIFTMMVTPRCGMPTLPQMHEGLGTDRNVLRSIAKHNTLEVEELGPGRWACAGILAGVISGGNIEVGSSMELKELSPG